MKILKPNILIILLLGAFSLLVANEKLDLNQATKEEMEQLPLTAEQIEAIDNYLTYIGPFNSIYELRMLDGMDQETLLKLKPLISLSKPVLEESQQRVEDNYYKMEQWMSSEGVSENFISQWMDLLANPVDVNHLGFFELMNFSGVSPVDALAVIKRQESGTITSRRDLRNAENLSYFGFSNLEDFITYTDEEAGEEWRGSFNTVVKNITLSQTPSDDAESYDKFQSRNYPLDTYARLKLNKGRNIQAEFSYLRNLGETVYANSDSTTQNVPWFKGFVAFKDMNLGPVNLNKVIVGNFLASFGQGVTMDATDFFMPRKSGFGWKKRYNGVSGNSSRTTQYGMNGIAVEAETGPVNASFFSSLTRKDAVVNEDGSFSALITMYPRLSYGLDSLMTENMVRSVSEALWGSHVKIMPIPGTYVGATIYQSYYDRALDLQVTETLLDPSATGKYLTQIGNSADPEIAASYENSSDASYLGISGATRRVYGLEFMTVVKNLCLQGEYSVLDKNLDLANAKSDPTAMVVSGYLQFDNLNFMLLYRDYDLEYDNPYQRSFSNYHRYKSTIYEDIYYLKDPILGYLYSASAQPQAEKGIYYSTRYQIHRTLVTQVEHDIWTRVADKAQYNRLVTSLEYRPQFKYRLRLRQKWQKRDDTNELSPVSYQANETRMEAILRMSNFNQIRILYALGFTQFTPRSRLVYNAETGEDSYIGNNGIHSSAIGVTITHNVNSRLKFLGSLMTYKGFLWNFEDTDFRVFNTTTQALHGWVAVFSRLSQNLSLRMKYSFDYHEPLTNIVEGYIDIGADDNNPALDEIYYSKNYSDFRLQLDYQF